MAKTYPLDVRSVGDDEYCVMSKGHHDPDAFMAAVRAGGYDWPLGKPVHKWVKAVPCRCGEHTCHYELSDERRPGWFPATYAWEHYELPATAGVSVPDTRTIPPHTPMEGE